MPSAENRPARYHTFTEYSPESMMIVEESGRFIAMNAAARAMLGYSREEIGELDLDRIGATSIRNRLPEFKQIGRVRAEGTLVKKDGNQLSAVFNTAAMGDGSFQFVLGQPAERGPSQETLFELAPIPLFEIELGSLCVRGLNRQARRLCGEAEGGDFVGKNLSELLGVADRDVGTLVRAALDGGAELYKRVWSLDVGDKSEHYVKAHLTLGAPGGENDARAILALCDITHEMFVQHELRSSVKEKTLRLKESPRGPEI